MVITSLKNKKMNLYETKIRNLGYDVDRVAENGCYRAIKEGKLFMGNTVEGLYVIIKQTEINDSKKVSTDKDN